MLGLEAHSGGVRLSAQLGSPWISGYFKQTSRGYLLPAVHQPLNNVCLEGGGRDVFGNIMECLEIFFGNLISFGSYTVSVKWAELGWLIVKIMFSWQEMERRVV